MLSNTLNTNEIKNAGAAEVEFQRLLINARETVFGQISETPSLPHRLSIKHTETGEGIKKRRRSLVRVDKTSMSGVDSTLPITNSAYIVLDTPVGASANGTEAANVLAELTSFVATLATSTFVYDGTGNGAAALLSGGL
jgi:hypothetical protein